MAEFGASGGSEKTGTLFAKSYERGLDRVRAAAIGDGFVTHKSPHCIVGAAVKLAPLTAVVAVTGDTRDAGLAGVGPDEQVG